MTTRWPGQHLHRRGGGAAQQSVPRSRLGRRGSLDHSSPATNDPFSPQAGRGGRSASRDARQAQEHPGPRPTGVYSQQRLFGVQTLRIPAPGGCGRAGRGRVSENLGEGGGPGQARPQGLRPGFTLPAWALQDPSCPASSAGPPGPQPPTPGWAEEEGHSLRVHSSGPGGQTPARGARPATRMPRAPLAPTSRH